MEVSVIVQLAIGIPALLLAAVAACMACRAAVQAKKASEQAESTARAAIELAGKVKTADRGAWFRAKDIAAFNSFQTVALIAAHPSVEESLRDQAAIKVRAHAESFLRAMSFPEETVTGPGCDLGRSD
jgi:hypothetical protein